MQTWSDGLEKVGFGRIIEVSSVGARLRLSLALPPLSRANVDEDWIGGEERYYLCEYVERSRENTRYRLTLLLTVSIYRDLYNGLLLQP